MQPISAESATLPRGFRFHHHEDPTTPESVLPEEPTQPSPPRVPRLKIRRRNVAQFHAPTEGFMASVAAADADIALPTIEIPERFDDTDMHDSINTPQHASGLLSPHPLAYRASPPRTPMPHLLTDTDASILQRPDWSMDADFPDDHGSRPGSSLSNPSDWSDDSYFSNSRIYRPSDDGSCTSPDSDLDDPFTFTSIGKAGAQELWTSQNPAVPAPENVSNSQIHTKARRGAPWSRDMSEHLWHIYQIYLQDPTVTPFRIGASAVPPEGVIHRVAREAKRSWKGKKFPKGQDRSQSLTSNISSIGLAESSDTTKSGSTTPTGEIFPRIYVQWVHSSAATRTHLRELCKRRDAMSVQRHRHLQTKSPTPFSQPHPRMRGRLPTPAHSRISSFSTKDIALSLTTCSAGSMQPDGPLAKLTGSTGASTEHSMDHSTFDDKQAFGLGITVDPDSRSRRLGSPFSSHTYGPSSTKPITGPPSYPNQSDNGPTSGQPLASPFSFDQAKSLGGTQKRRAQHSLEEEMSPNGAVLRPSILDEQLFGGPPPENHRRVRRSRGFSLGDEALRHGIPGLFVPPILATDALTKASEVNSPSLITTSTLATPSLLPAAIFDPPRLGSPFLETRTNNTFPRRLFPTTVDSPGTIRRRPFATMHHSRRSIESFDFGEGPSLQSKLSLLDEKLAEIRDREEAGRSRTKE